MENALSQWNALYRVRRAARWMLRALPAGAALSLGFSLPLMFSAALLRREFILLSGLLILGSVFLAGLIALLWPVDDLRVARHVERACGLQERLSTALEYRARPENPLYQRLQADAAQRAAEVSAEAVLRFRLPAWQLWLTLALLAANVLTGAQRSPFQRAAQRRQTRQAIEQELRAVEALREETAGRADLSPEEKARLDEILAQTARQLAEAQSLEEADAALENGRQFLKTLAPQEAQQLADALRQGGDALRAQTEGPLDDVAQALSQGDLLSAAQKLQSLDAESLSPAQREALAGQLNALAQRVAGADPALAEKLRQAAQAVQQADAARTEDALTQAAEALRQDAARIQQAAAAAQLEQQLAQGQQRLLYTGQPGGPQQAGASGGGTSAQGGAAGSAPGGLWDGQPDGGSPAPGSPAGNAPIQPGSGGASIEALEAPDPRLSGGTETVTIPGVDAPEGLITGEGSAQPAENTPLTVPYEEALPQYLDSYRQALDDESIPPQLREVIRQYFGSLEP